MSTIQKQIGTFEDPDPTFFDIKIGGHSLMSKSTREISKISFGDMQVANNLQLDSFGQEIENIVFESKEEMDDLENGIVQMSSKVREVFVMVDLPEITK